MLAPYPFFMKRLFLLSLLLSTLAGTLSAQGFKVVGYLPSYRFAFQDHIRYDRLTHLNLAFLNPDMQGNLSIEGQDIDPVIAKARAANPDIQVFISVAGGFLTNEWANAWDYFMQPAQRSAFIHSLIQYLETHDLDGIDVDLEWQHVTSHYSPFVMELADSLWAKDLLMTAAWPGTTRYAQISNEALARFDWVNLMAYDLTGPWAPHHPGPHSPYSFALQSLTYWKDQQGVAGDRLTLGVPFYGRSWDHGDTGQAFTYASIVAEDTIHAYLDQVGHRWYNGIPTILAKTARAQAESGGIMIWELGQDVLGVHEHLSLLAAIDAQVSSATPLELALPQAAIRLFPNPFGDQLSLAYDGPAQFAPIALLDMQGRTVMAQEVWLDGTEIDLPVAQLPAGMYLCRLRTKAGILQAKVVRR